MRLGPGLLYEGRTLQGARPKLADFCSATMAEFYSAVDTYLIYLTLIIAPPLLSRYLHMRYFGGTIIAVVVVDILLLRYAYISFFCLLAGLGTLHLIYIILRNKCARECPMLFA